jgi:hypothetical protein
MHSDQDIEIIVTDKDGKVLPNVPIILNFHVRGDTEQVELHSKLEPLKYRYRAHAVGRYTIFATVQDSTGRWTASSASFQSYAAIPSKLSLLTY